MDISISRIRKVLHSRSPLEIAQIAWARSLRGIGAFLQALFRKVGIDVYPHRPRYLHVPEYFGRSAAKRIDITKLPKFGPLATQAIETGRSCLYYDRLYNVFQGLETVKRNWPSSPITMAEVGVYKGGTSKFIVESARALNFTSPRLFSVDSFEGHHPDDVIGRIDTVHKPHFFADTSYESVSELLKPYPEIRVLKGRIQQRAADLEKETFHWVHLDMDLYEPTLFALHFFDKRLISGGIILIDDHGTVSCPGIDRSVDEFLATTDRYLKLDLLSGQCLLVKH